MKVSELAKNLNTTNDVVLKTLQSLKLKAKDGKQELSTAVVSVIKSQITSNTTTKESPKVAIKTKVVKKDKEKADKIIKKIVSKKPKKEEKAKKKSSKITSKKILTTVKKSIVKKKVRSKNSLRTKPKISKEPVITLKPLVRKRKRPIAPGKYAPKSSQSSKEKVEMIVEDAEQNIKTGILTGKDVNSGQATLEEQKVKEVQEFERDESLPDIEIRVPITVKDFSVKIQQKPSEVLKQLMKMGIFAHMNQSMDADIVHKLTRDFGFNLAKVRTEEEQLLKTHKQEDENPDLLKSRAPVITFMGHVDHGKTSLIDKVRRSNVADREHGGITQHIGAYSVVVQKGRITFLDTPGHEAFTAMRARGAHITDIIVLVIAADEGIMPQTQEAIDHARAAEVPIVVALNKIDKKNADIDRVKKQLQEVDLAPEDWGGKTIVASVSAVTGEGIDELLELILLESELLELKANDQKNASGIVVDAHLSGGKGVVSTLIVQSGTLRNGDVIIVGQYYGKIKAMFDDHQRSIKEAGPSMPVEILGLPGAPEAGEMFYVVENESQAKEIAFRRQEQLKNEKLHARSKITLEDLHAQIEKGSIKELNVILKSDVQGSLEALKDSLDKIPSDKVKLKFIHTGLSDVNASDVLLALASNAIIIAFHVGIGPRAKIELEEHPVDVRQYRIIYDAVDDIRNALEGLLDPKTNKKFISRVEIREVFKLSKSGIVAGCYVTKGKISRKDTIDIIRDDEIIFSGQISSLKRFKDDVRDVNEGMECGISVSGFDKIQAGDIIESYEIEKIAQKL